MKKNFYRSLLILSTFSCLMESNAQVVITQDNFPRDASFTDNFFKASTASFTMPTEGPNQVWDYNALEISTESNINYFSAAGDPDFPNALNSRQADLSFQGFLIPNKNYEAIDADGWYNLGRNTTDVAYPISTITGGPNDSLRFVGGALAFDGRINNLKFPMTYGNTWTESHTEILNYQLSVAAFGLNKTPGQQKRYQTQTREVVGHGMLSIPKPDGSQGNPMEVLLIKTKHHAVDSIFLAGAPGPAPLMSAFGLTQGSMVTDSFYVFYRPGFGATVLNINYPTSSSAVSAFYRPQANNVNTAVSTGHPRSFWHFPNPVRAGESFSLDMPEQSTSENHIRLFNMQGIQVFQSTISAAKQVKIPAELPAGMYRYQVFGAGSDLIGVGKIQVIR